MTKPIIQFDTTMADIKTEVDEWPVVKDARAFFKNKPKELEMFIEGLYRDQYNLRCFEETMSKWEQFLNKGSRTELVIATASATALLGVIAGSTIFDFTHWSVSALYVSLLFVFSVTVLSVFMENRSLKKAIEAERTNGRKFYSTVEINKAALETIIMTQEVKYECEGQEVSLH